MQLLSKVLLLGNVGFLLDYSPTRDPEGGSSKQSKASLLRIFVFFICLDLKKLTFDVGQIKKASLSASF